MSIEQAKKAASIKALEYIHDGMTIGLGTGSTAQYFIEHLIEKCKKGLKIRVAATSNASEKKANEGGIPLINNKDLQTLDLTVDGADEIDQKKRLIKGKGGAFVREKIIASMSKEMIVIADETKLVKTLGGCPVPIEVIPFGMEATRKHIENLGYRGSFRKRDETSLYSTDNGNVVFDLQFPRPIGDPESIHHELINIPGVVDTGFFFNLASRIIIGKTDGQTTVQ